MYTGAPGTRNPNFAGSPGSGSRLNTGSVNVYAPVPKPSAFPPGRLIVVIATPTAVFAGQALPTEIGPSLRARNSPSVQRGIGVGLPTRPAGHLKCRSLVSCGEAGAPTSLRTSLKLNAVVS